MSSRSEATAKVFLSCLNLCFYQSMFSHNDDSSFPSLASRLPDRALAQVLFYLPLSDVGSCMRVCRRWARYLSVEDNDIWRILCEDTLPHAAQTDPYLFSKVPTSKAKLRAWRNCWSSEDCSRNAFVKLNNFTFHRNPIAQSTDGARGKRGYNNGRHCWEVWWEGPLGTVAVVGVATKHAALQCQGYVALLGSDDQGWGWNLVDNSLLHNGRVARQYPQMNNAPRYLMGDRIRVILDCDAHVLYFERNSCEFLGIAFSDIPPVKLYPCVSAVYGNTEVTMVYTGAPEDG